MELRLNVPHFARREILLGIPCLNLQHEQRAAGLQTFNNLKFGLKIRHAHMDCVALVFLKSSTSYIKAKQYIS